MKKSIIVIIMITSMALLSGCSIIKDKGDDLEPESLEWNVSREYTLSATCNGLTPYGVAVDQNSVIICDMDDNCLREYDFYGNELGEIGQLGNGEGEFIRPTGVSYANGYIYIVDSGNNRIQIFDSKYEYQREIELDKLRDSIDTFYTDIEIRQDGSGIILTNSLIPEDARAYRFDTEGSVEKMSYIINGYASCDDNRIYCLNTYKLSENKSSYVANVRESILCEVSDNEVSDICKFPYKYGPTDFIIDGDDIYVLSCGWAELDHFKIDGSYIETIWKFDLLSPESFLARTPENGFVVTDENNKVVYFINHKSK